MDRKSSIHDFKGGDNEWKKDAREKTEHAFSQRRWFADMERKKTREELQVIKTVVPMLQDFLKQYGVESLPITARQIHVISKAKMTPGARAYIEEQTRNKLGIFRPEAQRIYIPGWEHDSLLSFILALVHELVHFYSFTTLRKSPQSNEPVLQTNGLYTVRHETKNAQEAVFFNEINEAVTEELVIRFMNKLATIPALSKAFADMKELRRQHKDDDVIYSRLVARFTAEGPQIDEMVYKHGYPKSRQKLAGLIDEIFSQDSKRFTSKEEVFAVFAKAAMTGNVREMAFLVEGLGRGRLRELSHREAARTEME